MSNCTNSRYLETETVSVGNIFQEIMLSQSQINDFMNYKKEKFIQGALSDAKERVL